MPRVRVIVAPREGFPGYGAAGIYWANGQNPDRDISDAQLQELKTCGGPISFLEVPPEPAPVPAPVAAAPAAAPAPDPAPPAAAKPSIDDDVPPAPPPASSGKGKRG